MAAIDPATILRVPGVLSADGTPLGPIKDAVFIPNIKYGANTAEEYGNVPVEIYNLGSTAVFMAVLRSFDADAVAAVFPGTSATPLYSVVATESPTTNSRPGSSLDTEAVELVFTPDASAHPGITIHHAIPLIDEQARIAYSWGTEWGIPVVFAAVPDSTGNMWEIS